MTETPCINSNVTWYLWICHDIWCFNGFCMAIKKNNETNSTK